MAVRTILAAQTGEATVYFNSAPYENFILVASSLAGGEEVDIEVEAAAGVYVVATDINGVALKLAGTAGTSNARTLQLAGGPAYKIHKDATAEACELRVIEGRGINS